MPIQKLSPLLINQIAAGEVIERPASVVKELVENALDAAATRIDVRVEDGGRELIRVADDGCGIERGELGLALATHATSKIVDAEDLNGIATMGFRGEAMASIASISRMKLTSKVGGAEAGGVIEASGAEIGEAAPIGCAPGTVTEVRNLFFNTPARRKFMRGAPTEFGRINDVLTRIAMANPEVGFRLTHNERKAVFDLPPEQTARSRCVSLLGGEMEEALLEFESDEGGFRIWGLAGLPEVARSTAKFQYVFVNGRPIRDRSVGHAMKEAYRGLIDPTQQPTVVLFIEMDPKGVDVNVHPAKTEVRFAEGRGLHSQVLSSIRQALLGADLTPRVGFGGGSKAAVIEPTKLDLGGGMSGGGFGGGGFSSGGVGGSVGSAGAPGSSPASKQESASAFVDYFKGMDPKQKGFVYQQVKQEVEEEPAALAAAKEAEDEKPLVGPMRDAGSMLQVHNSYIVTQDERGIVIIDQHALHERMMFEDLYERICGSGSLESQRLLTPVVLAADAGRLDLVERMGPLFEKLGIEAGALGPATMGVHAFPTLLFERNVEIESFMVDLMDRAAEQDFTPTDEAALHEVLDMMSCKAAVKAGDSLAEGELAALLGRRDEIERSSNCPHGRPTTIRLTLDDLEKHFHRS